jgi:hypothetical protein
MILIPYKRVSLKTSLKKSEIESILKRIISEPSWRIKISSSANNEIIEGRVTEKSFIISLGRFSSTYGRTTFLPIMKGEVFQESHSSGSTIDAVIRPSKIGIGILLFFYFICGVVIYFSVIKQLSGGIVVGGLFYLITYCILIVNFNMMYAKFVRIAKQNLIR